MNGITVRPEVRPDKCYNTTQAVKALEMSRTTFHVAVKKGMIPKTFRKGELESTEPGKRPRPLFRGRDILKFWGKYLAPI